MVTAGDEHRHSADVDMRLLINGFSLSIAQLGWDFLLLKEGVNHPPGNADIVLKIDDEEQVWRVYLPNGVVVGDRRVAIELCK